MGTSQEAMVDIIDTIEMTEMVETVEMIAHRFQPTHESP